MSKILLSNLANLQNENTAVTTINSNFSTIQTAMDNTLSRDGTLPNQMSSNSDMNSNRVINLPYPVTNEEPLKFGYFKQFTITPTIGATAYDINWTQPATGGTTHSIGNVLQRTFDVRDFGAVCNGVANDTVAIQNCINAAQAAGTDSIVLLHGNSFINAALNITSPVTIKGAGKSNTFLTSNNHAASIINFNPSSQNCSVQLIGFGAYYTSLPSGTSVPGIAFGNSSFLNTDCIIYDVAVVNAGIGIYMLNSFANRILHCNITGYWQAGIRINSPLLPDGGTCWIQSCFINNGLANPINYNVWWNNGGGIILTGNFFGNVGANASIGIFFDYTLATSEIRVSNNLFFGHSQGVTFQRQPGLYMYEVIITDNIFDSCPTAIYVPAEGGTPPAWFQMLIITWNGFQGRFGSIGPLISIAGVQGSTISGNTFLSNVGGGGLTCIQTISNCADFKIGPNARTVQINPAGSTLAADSIAGTNMTIVGGG